MFYIVNTFMFVMKRNEISSQLGENKSKIFLKDTAKIELINAL